MSDDRASSARSTVPDFGRNLQQIVMHHLETESGRHRRETPPDPPQAPDPQPHLVELPRRGEVRPQRLPRGRVHRPLDPEPPPPRSHDLHETGDDILDHRLRVRVRSVDHDDVPGGAGIEIDVVRPDPGPGHDPQPRPAVEQGIIDAGVGPHDEGVGVGELVEEGGVRRRATPQIHPGRQPRRRLGIERLRAHDATTRDFHHGLDSGRGTVRLEP